MRTTITVMKNYLLALFLILNGCAQTQVQKTAAPEKKQAVFSVVGQRSSKDPSKDCNDPLSFSRVKLALCEGASFKVVPSNDPKFDFIYFKRDGRFVEYVHDKKADKMCSVGPVDKMKSSSDKHDCYPCGDSEC